MKWLLFVAALGGCMGEAPPRGTLRGTISDAATGEPIAGATVVVTDDDGEKAEISDENGRYVIDEIIAGRVVVRIFFGNRKVEASIDIDENHTATLETSIVLPPFEAFIDEE